MPDAPSLVVASWPVVRHWPSEFKEEVPADRRVGWPTKALAASLVLMAVASNLAAMVKGRQGAYDAVPEGLATAAHAWLASGRNASHPELTVGLEAAWAHINRRESWYYAGIGIAAPGVAMVLVNSGMFWTSLDLQVRVRTVVLVAAYAASLLCSHVIGSWGLVAKRPVADGSCDDSAVDLHALVLVYCALASFATSLWAWSGKFLAIPEASADSSESDDGSSAADAEERRVRFGAFARLVERLSWPMGCLVVAGAWVLFLSALRLGVLNAEMVLRVGDGLLALGTAALVLARLVVICLAGFRFRARLRRALTTCCSYKSGPTGGDFTVGLVLFAAIIIMADTLASRLID
ncbi:hypothetical protein FNF31_07309 [Cafeteria roenbergensis]|uniref:Uncharacterized protein n=1 Tax=Cafeteria roenbergensis TaxID=33653 RepID=A0A5A8C746_CAFRO|nr:hypothetical protein FNF31_07309 [Cafeteria roenbergensis]